VVSGNIISSNNYYGIYLNYASNNVVSYNTITNNVDGISLNYASNNVVFGNTVSSNNYGISLDSSNNNVVSGNTITNNFLGISLIISNNTIYHNNFNNTLQANSYASKNVWDYGNEGNYWSNYPWQDLNEDGIGDVPYVISGVTDNYPLMGMFSDFPVIHQEETYYVTTICSSTISEFRFEIGPETGNKIIRFNVTSKDITVGFCRVKIPTELMNYPYIVLVGTEEIVPTILDVSNETYAYLYFTYTYSNYTITIISSKTLHLYNELLDKYAKLQTDLYNLNVTYNNLLNNYSSLLGNYSQLQEDYRELNNSYQEHLLNYSSLLGNYSQLQEDYYELNSSYQEHLLHYNENAHNIRNLMYILATTTAIFIATTIYLSKSAHASKTKVFKNRE
jgi:parallel beta-helix repeat protein